MYCHRVAVEVGVVRRTDERMHLDSVAFDKHWAECLNRLAVQSRCAIQEYVLVFDCLFENWPHLGSLVFDEASCATDVVCEFAREKSLNNERTEELEHHVLRQTELVEREIGSDDDDGASRVVHAF